ncbi:class I SAM-dependent methyltransferase [Thiohalophilus thiocyanatoxydans]|uniref:Methyltransferase family protein n=1 Tax=Thiohalophilus thiocyanatoxydans TaxID=381308 RepID=A0A4R8J1W3_9GAMM|nr:class I SAM-dependent methyltransferase [Thiohalophilus thiocyanatoxydans]TDY04317.1 methyltransferase family protein [Thiohalophilus thiocyanatoxydans]
MSLKHSYTLLAPFYDLIVNGPTAGMRRNSLARLGDVRDQTILLSGIGTGLDIPDLPAGPSYVGIDLTTAMLRRAQHRVGQRDDIRLHCGDVMRLPYGEQQFDIVLMHLILAVVPHPEQALREATRVVRTGGRILILDKFLRHGQRAPLRRALNGVIRHIATRTDVVLEPLLAQCPELQLVEETRLAPGGWFHQIELKKQDK